MNDCLVPNLESLLTLPLSTLLPILLCCLLGIFSVVAKYTPGEADNKLVQRGIDLIHLIGMTKKFPVVLALALFMTVSLTACATGTPNDCQREVAAAEIAITQGYETTAKLVTSGVIDKATGRKALVALDAANAATDNAGPLCKIHDPKFSDYLQKAASALAQFATLTGGK